MIRAPFRPGDTVHIIDPDTVTVLSDPAEVLDIFPDEQMLGGWLTRLEIPCQCCGEPEVGVGSGTLERAVLV